MKGVDKLNNTSVQNVSQDATTACSKLRAQMTWNKSVQYPVLHGGQYSTLPKAQMSDFLTY